MINSLFFASLFGGREDGRMVGCQLKLYLEYPAHPPVCSPVYRLGIPAHTRRNIPGQSAGSA